MQESVCVHIAVLYTLPQLKKKPLILNPNTEAHFFGGKIMQWNMFKKSLAKFVFWDSGKTKQY